MGDPSKLSILREVIRSMREERLVENTAVVGRYMLDMLMAVQVRTMAL